MKLKVINSYQVQAEKNSNNCDVTEYSFGDKDIDLAVAKINGRYPEKGFCMNTISKELIYIVEGNGSVCFENKKIQFSKGDSILIEPNEKYYWDVKNCIATMTCTPSFKKEQYKLVD